MESQYTDLGDVPAPASLTELIKELHRVFSEDKVNVEYVKQLMTSYKSNPKEWKKFAKFDPHRFAVFSIKHKVPQSQLRLGLENKLIMILINWECDID